MAPPTDELVISRWLVERIAGLLEVEQATIDPSEMLEDVGVSSPDAVVLMVDLTELMEAPVSAVVLWDYPTIASLAAFLAAVARGEEELPEDLLDLDFG